MNATQRNKYVEYAVQTASGAQLLLMLFDGAIGFGRQAIGAIAQKNYEAAHHNIQRVHAIVSEFMITLDRTAPVSPSLLALYDYLLSRLIIANVKKDQAIIEEVIGFLMEMRMMWADVARQVPKPPVQEHA